MNYVYSTKQFRKYNYKFEYSYFAYYINWHQSNLNQKI